MGAENGAAATAKIREPVMMLSVRDAYRRWAPTYDESPNPIVSLIDRHMDPGYLRGKIAVDVACGTGRRAAKIGAIGVDLSFDMLSRSTGKKVQADARHLPFPDGVADLVLCALALGYIDPARGLMNELRRIARPGGIVIAADLHPQAIAAGWKRSFRANGANCEIESHP